MSSVGAVLNRTTKLFRNGRDHGILVVSLETLSGMPCPAPRFVRPLDVAELAALQERFRTSNDADERSRCQMLLFSARGKTVPEIYVCTLGSIVSLPPPMEGAQRQCPFGQVSE
jgi:hypothetical protein